MEYRGGRRLLKNLPKKKAGLQEVVADTPAAHCSSSVYAVVIKTLTKINLKEQKCVQLPGYRLIQGSQRKKYISAPRIKLSSREDNLGAQGRDLEAETETWRNAACWLASVHTHLPFLYSPG